MYTKMDNKIAFFFGAGISIPAKIPKTEEITQILLTGKFDDKNINRDLIGSYSVNNPKLEWSLYNEIPGRVINFLKILRKELEKYYTKSIRSINYEDIYYYLDFIDNNYFDLEGNPALKYVLKELEPIIKNILIPLDPLFEHTYDLNSLLPESKRYIKQIVSKLLSKKAESFDGLKFLHQVISQNEYRYIDIFTLNHDTVLEQFFEFNNILFNDGFQKENNNVDFWEPQLFENEDVLKLYKMHGSVNWRYHDQTSWQNNRICKIPLPLLYSYDIIDNAFILIGTQNKTTEYIKALYLELYYRFYKTLNYHNNLIIAGYSFNDGGINSKIFNWLDNPLHRIIIVDPKVEEMKIKIPTRFISAWDENKRIKRIPGYIEKITWDDIKTKLK
jgi:hypothetical protein